MKKLMAILLSCVLLVSLAACGNSSKEKETEATRADTSAETAADEGNAADPEDDDTKEIEEEKEDKKDKKSSGDLATIEEMVLVDENDILIKAMDLKMDKTWGLELSVYIENNSDQSITVQTRDSSINDLMVYSSISADVAAGKKSNETISFYIEDLELNNIEEIGVIELYFHIFESDSWDDIFDSEMIEIKTSAFDSYSQELPEGGDVLYDAEGIKITYLYEADDSWSGPEYVLFIENDTDNDITIQARDESINGFMISAIISCDVKAGKKAIDTLAFSDTDLEDNGIETVEEIELYFHIYELDSWDTIVDTDLIKIENP